VAADDFLRVGEGAAAGSLYQLLRVERGVDQMRLRMALWRLAPALD